MAPSEELSSGDQSADFESGAVERQASAGHADWTSGQFWTPMVPWCPTWIASLPDVYWSTMTPVIARNFFKRPQFETWVLSDGAVPMAGQLITRMAQADQLLVPWLSQAISLEGARILEIGAGTGCTTAALARAGAHVTGVDLSPGFIEANSERLRALGLEADVYVVEADWLSKEVFEAPFNQQFDAIVCYALLEHLYPLERLNLLRACKRVMERTGALLVIFETPNRFAPIDWHSTRLPFADILPEELMFEYSKLSPRADTPAVLLPNNYQEATARSWRFGRAASWHEFHLTLGLEQIEIVLDGYDSMARRNHGFFAVPDFEAALADVFSTFDPPVPKSFCRPSLDLVLRLKSKVTVS